MGMLERQARDFPGGSEVNLPASAVLEVQLLVGELTSHMLKGGQGGATTTGEKPACCHKEPTSVECGNQDLMQPN